MGFYNVLARIGWLGPAKRTWKELKREDPLIYSKVIKASQRPQLLSTEQIRNAAKYETQGRPYEILILEPAFHELSSQSGMYCGGNSESNRLSESRYTRAIFPRRAFLTGNAEMLRSIEQKLKDDIRFLSNDQLEEIADLHEKRVSYELEVVPEVIETNESRNLVHEDPVSSMGDVYDVSITQSLVSPRQIRINKKGPVKNLI